MNIERMRPSGGLRISDIVNGHLFQRRYYDYTRAEAISIFRQERREEKDKAKAKSK